MSALAEPARRGRARAVGAALRPSEWVKNAFVLAPLMFGGRFDETDAVVRGLAVAVAFCAVSSAGYIVNDVLDAEADRRHPVKRRRPIASGELAVAPAIALAAALAAAGVAAAAAVDLGAGAVLAGYGLLTAAYSVTLKHLVILDVMTIGACFLLRVEAGALAVDVTASEWLLFCTAMLALFLGFTKRRQEALRESEEPRRTRRVLEHYSLPFLDQMVSLVTAGALLSYGIYAIDSPLIGGRMLWTAPIVLYGLFRYLYLIYDRQDDRDAAVLVSSDPGIIAALVAWVITVALLLYI